jgi:hypothetical protein
MERNSKNNSNARGAQQVPPQQTGSEMNAVEKIELSSEAEAIDFFKTVKNRLLDVNRWTKLAGSGMSHFFLTDSGGNLVERKATTGDFIKIDIPGPGSKTGGGYDWVKIEEIKEQLTECDYYLTSAPDKKNLYLIDTLADLGAGICHSRAQQQPLF